MPATVIPMTDPIMVSWGRHMAAKGRSPGTIHIRQHYLQRMLAGRHPDTITVTDIEQWLAEYPHWSPNTRRCAVASIRSFYRWRDAATNPAATLEAPRQSAPCPKPCPDHIYEAALAHATGDQWWLLRIAGATGMRRAELASLSPANVEGHFLRVRGKGSKTRRIPAPEDVRGWLLSREVWAWPSPYAGHGHVDPDAVGKRLARSLGRPWTAHTLRHRFATVTYAACHDLAVVQRLLGHASLATTERYLATGDEQLVAAVAWADRPPLRLAG